MLDNNRGMNDEKVVSGFSRLNKTGKMKWVVENFFRDPEAVSRELMSFCHTNEDQQRVFDGFSENTISNFFLPYGVAPNFMIDGKHYCVPMVIEESSVVAAAAGAAKFWLDRGGFHTRIISTTKLGQVHFIWKGDASLLFSAFETIRQRMYRDVAHITANMNNRGGGVQDVRLLDMTHLEEGYYQIKAVFETCDSMGANFINSVLESFAESMKHFVKEQTDWPQESRDINVIMAILSNYTPECLVRAWVECPVDKLGSFGPEMPAATFAEKFERAVRIAHFDVHRATTHNKGIFNGIDAVVIATGNDFRAIEACGHTYAARDGQYKSLSDCSIENGVFKFWLDIPMAIGTVGGLTSLHPIARRSLEMLGNPSARELMSVIAATGLAQNFAAVRSLVTTGIQKGHMRMHLLNILNHMDATEKEIHAALQYFSNKVVSFSSVRDFIQWLRGKQNDTEGGLNYSPVRS